MSIIEHFSDFFGETEHFSGKNGALIRWNILVGKQKHNVQKPISGSGWPPLISYPDLTLFHTEKWAVGDLGTRLDLPLFTWRSGSASEIWAKILAFHPENFKWDQTLKFLTLSKTTSSYGCPPFRLKCCACECWNDWPACRSKGLCCHESLVASSKSY